MMFYWNTGDRATDSNLQKLSSVTDWPVDRNIESDALLDYVCLLIRIEEMLPQACRFHFHWPNLFVGSAPDRWDQQHRNNFWRSVCEKIREGLENVAADPTLKANGGADLNDRPKSRGEVILEALARYQESRSRSALSALMMAVTSTPLQSRVNTVTKLENRKRPVGNRSPEIAIQEELSRLRFEAEHFHHLKA